MMPTKYPCESDIYDGLAVVNIYKDGSVLVSHGGCEIGQGIHTKVAQAVAYALGCDLSVVRVADTETSKAPNNSGTGGSGTSETMVAAALEACKELSGRLAPYRKKQPDWKTAVAAAQKDRICLSAEGWHGQGSPSLKYATQGVGISEVEVDVLTGEVEIHRVDILMDQGRQLNAAIDLGQVEGGFVIALGYFFTEEVRFSTQGEQLNIGTWEYKIPSYCDVPAEFNVSLLGATPNPSGVLGSKASAEPVMSLAASAYFAAKFAVYAARKETGPGGGFFQLPVPCTTEQLRQACGLRDEALAVP